MGEILRLIAITDGLRGGADALIQRALAAEAGGATCIQLRLKEVAARELAEIARALQRELTVPLIINDRADVAIAVGVGGCHVGPDDMPARAIRNIAPAGFVIGCSVGNDAELPELEGADYAGVGPVFTTATKFDAGAAIGIAGLSALISKARMPVVGIGGITPANARGVIEAGAAGVAAIDSIFGQSNVEAAARAMAAAIGT